MTESNGDRFRSVNLAGRLLQLALSIALAFAWLRSAAAHATNPYFFLSSVYNYKLVGPVSGRFIATVLPSVQLALALCLVMRVCVGGALLSTLYS